MVDATPGVSKTVAALAVGAACTIIGNVFNHIDPALFGPGVAAAIVAGLKQSDSMSAIQTLLTVGFVYFVPHGGEAVLASGGSGSSSA